MTTPVRDLNPDRVYTLTNLNTWEGDGRSLAVLGHPVKHSISPHMHNAALLFLTRKTPLFAHWHYFKFDIHPDQLADALYLLFEKRFTGVNLTIPHKVSALNLVESLDSPVRRMGALNTLHRQPHGFHGYNTDGFGLEMALRFDLEAELKNSTIIILGAGGAARAAAVQCLERGCGELWIGNRSQDRLDALVADLSVLYHEKDGDGSNQDPRIRGFNLNDLPRDLPRTGLLVNATSLGLRPDAPSPLDLSGFDRSLKVFDMIYNPPRTALLNQAERLGMHSSGGLSMLVWQGVRSLEYWTGEKIDPHSMRNAAIQALNLAPR